MKAIIMHLSKITFLVFGCAVTSLAQASECSQLCETFVAQLPSNQGYVAGQTLAQNVCLSFTGQTQIMCNGIFQYLAQQSGVTQDSCVQYCTSASAAGWVQGGSD